MADKIENQRNEGIESLELDNTQGITFENVMNFLKEIDVDANQKIDENEVNLSFDSDFLNEEKNLAKFGESLDHLNDIDDDMKKELLTSFKSALDNIFNEIIRKDEIIREDEKKVLEFWEKVFGGKRPDDERKLEEFRKRQEELEKERNEIEDVDFSACIDRFNSLPEKEKTDIKKICKEDLNNLDSFKRGLDIAVSGLQGKSQWNEGDIMNANNLKKILGGEKSDILIRLEDIVRSKLDEVMSDIISCIVKNGVITADKTQCKIMQLGANVLSGNDLKLDGSMGQEKWNFKKQTENEIKTNSYMWKMIIMNRNEIMEKRREKDLLYIPDLDNYLNQIQDEGQKEKTWTEFLEFFLGSVYHHGIHFENVIKGSRFEELLSLMIRRDIGTTVEEEISYLEGLSERTTNQESILQKLKSGNNQDTIKLYNEEINELKTNIMNKEKGNVSKEKRAANLKSIEKLRAKVEDIDSNSAKNEYIKKIDDLENKIISTSETRELENIKSEIANISQELDNYLSGEENRKTLEETENLPFDITLEELGAISDTVCRTSASDYDSLYNDKEATQLIFKLLNYFGFPQNKSDKKGASQLEDLVGQFLTKNGGQDAAMLKNNPKEMFKFLATKFYDSCLTKLEKDSQAVRKYTATRDKRYKCLCCLLDIDAKKNKEINNNGIYKKVYSDDLLILGYKSLEDFKKQIQQYENKQCNSREDFLESLEDFKKGMQQNENDTIDTKYALMELREKAQSFSASNQTNTVSSDGLRELGRRIEAPSAYGKLSEKEEEYINHMINKGNKILTISQYNELFSNFYCVQQGTIGDCYFVAAVRGLARIPEFPTLVRTSISENIDGTYTVRLPLGEPNGIEYKINKQELKNAKIDGSDGYKLLEIAYYKYMDGDKVLSSEKDLERITAGTGRLALKSLLGYEGFDMSYNINLMGDRGEENKAKVINILKKFNPKNGDILTITSYNLIDGSFELSHSNPNGSKDYLSRTHVYCLLDVRTDKNGDITDIIVENPHNNGGEQKHVTLEEFFKFASNIEYGHTTNDFLNTTSSDFLGTQHASLQARHYAKNIFRCAYDECGDIVESVGKGEILTAAKQTGIFIYHEMANVGGVLVYTGKTIGLGVIEGVSHIYNNLVSGNWF